MLFFKEKILSPGQLKRLSEHKYSCDSASICDKLLQPWWNWLVSRVPIWLAPNLITISGLIVNILTTLILMWYSPDAIVEAPRWTFVVCALGLFVYQSLDAIDGKQARRTGTSSPLGELFDHGCDSISTVFVAVSACIAVKLGSYPSWMFFQCFCAVTLFYCAHWQTYVSGTLRFGKVDVTEAQFTIMGIHLVSAFLGPSIWETKIVPSIDTFVLWHLMFLMTVICSSVALYHIFFIIFTGGIGKNGSTVAISGLSSQVNHLMAVVFFIGFGKMFFSFSHIFWTGGAGKNGSTVALPWFEVELRYVQFVFAILIEFYLFIVNASIVLGGGVGKNGSSVAGTSVLSPVIPLSLVVIPAYIIYRKSPQHVFEQHPVLYIIAFGLVAAKVTNKLVVAHMTKNEMEYFDSALIGPAMLFLNQYFNVFIPEYIVLYLCLIWVCFDLIRYCRQVCLEICEHMRIELFRIVPNLSSNQSAYSSVLSQPFSKNAYLDRDQALTPISEDEVHLLTDDQDEFVVFDANQ